jgi:hypothetical protein
MAKVTNMVRLSGVHALGKDFGDDWVIEEVIRGELPTCGVCNNAVDWADKDTGFVKHSGSPICGTCIRKFTVGTWKVEA